MHLMVLRTFWPATSSTGETLRTTCLNAPYGAPRFLTGSHPHEVRQDLDALMHLMALRAF